MKIIIACLVLFLSLQGCKKSEETTSFKSIKGNEEMGSGSNNNNEPSPDQGNGQDDDPLPPLSHFIPKREISYSGYWPFEVYAQEFVENSGPNSTLINCSAKTPSQIAQFNLRLKNAAYEIASGNYDPSNYLHELLVYIGKDICECGTVIQRASTPQNHLWNSNYADTNLLRSSIIWTYSVEVTSCIDSKYFNFNVSCAGNFKN